jgi:ABC-type polysaccharide/polyol phosphate export permease
LIVVGVVLARFSTLLIGLAVAFLWAALAPPHPSWTPWSAAPQIVLGCLLLLVLTLGASLIVACTQVILGDTAFLARFGLRLGFYAVPVIYPVSRVPDEFRSLYELNPLVGIVSLFNGTLTGSTHSSTNALVSAIIGAAVVGVGGYVIFRIVQPAVSEVL